MDFSGLFNEIRRSLIGYDTEDYEGNDQQGFELRYPLVNALTEYPSVIEIYDQEIEVGQASGQARVFQGEYGESYILKLDLDMGFWEEFRNIGRTEFGSRVIEIYDWETPDQHLTPSYDSDSNSAAILIKDEGLNEAKKFTQELVSALNEVQ